MSVMKTNVSVVRLIVATWSSGPPASGKIIKEMPGSVASGTSYITAQGMNVSPFRPVLLVKSGNGNYAWIWIEIGLTPE